MYRRGWWDWWRRPWAPLSTHGFIWPRCSCVAAGLRDDPLTSSNSPTHWALGKNPEGLGPPGWAALTKKMYEWQEISFTWFFFSLTNLYMSFSLVKFWMFWFLPLNGKWYNFITSKWVTLQEFILYSKMTPHLSSIFAFRVDTFTFL